MTTARPINTAWHPLADGNPPAWASGWGQDRHGVFVDFTLDKVTQRLRWVPPGRFLMGSPEDEPGRVADEGPQHPVTISRGFWMFDTPCTQALWQAVMDNNPSHFKSPDRPVEQVSWIDVQEFITSANQRIPSLDLTLPTEAQWEYACRAGTTSALYNGPIEILGERNAPALDPIAWYGGNSGVGSDIDEGWDSKAWPEKQYPHERAGTHPVGLKRPNGWGLYDMLGNVWEWCRDGKRAYPNEAEINPSGPVAEASAERIFRGGSWYIFAHSVRAAPRRWRHPSYRFRILGFRCARLQP
jgi:formylglycine-generating enzyme required for sulfatase activity